ncbi:hypothetical protein JTE90_011325 [Oedothorax gibbosus]|uniref:Proton-coupled folate transporter n=1 Tax=Oedothorax gibbosus TaxID=931172 RepID=A0AAV6VM59_9ARAC|nr:hypothetical protein JTE90_011325 [Oedothorax gibbosus]
MTRKNSPPTISKIVSSSDYLYQGTTDDPPVPTHFENKISVATLSVDSQPKTGNIFKNLRLEVVSFLFTFSYVLTRISSTSMILVKVCNTHYKYPKYICDNLANFTEIKTTVERTSTNYQLGHTLIQTAPAALLSCFIGPWSDNYGRKIPVLVAIFGMTLDTLGSTISAYFIDSRVEYYYIAAAFTGFSGGTVVPLALVYSYASEMTTYGKRTMKYALIEMFTGLAQPIGVAAGGWFYNYLGYPAVFLLSTGGMFASFVWVALLLPETRGLNNKDPFSVKLKKLFTCKTFSESFIATTKERPQKGRKQVVLLILSMCFIIIATNSTTDISYLYVHHQFNWDTTVFSTVTAAYSFVTILLLIVVIPVLRWLKVSDPTLGLIGTTSTFLKFLGIGLSWRQTTYHIANLLGLLSACAPLAVRSRISKIVSNDDLGKVFSFVATSESLLPVLTTVLTSQIFNVFLNTFPGMPYIVLAVFLLIPFSVFTWLKCLPILNEDTNNDKSEIIRETYTEIKE